MTITSYQIDGLLKAYSRQNKSVSALAKEADSARNIPTTDIVELSIPLANKAEAFEKVSYSLVDVLLKNKTK